MDNQRREIQLLTKTEAAALVGLTRKTIAQWVQRGFLAEFFIYKKSGERKHVYGLLSSFEVEKVSRMSPSQRLDLIAKGDGVEYNEDTRK